jgi:plasmid stabilization system protein ParE
MNVLIRPEPDNGLDGIFAWIAKVNPHASIEIIRRIRAKRDLLAATGLAETGRPGREKGKHELIYLNSWK